MTLARCLLYPGTFSESAHPSMRNLTFCDCNRILSPARNDLLRTRTDGIVLCALTDASGQAISISEPPLPRTDRRRTMHHAAITLAVTLRPCPRNLNIVRTLNILRAMSSGGSLVRPAPPPLPREQQREFEELVRAAQAPLSVSAGKADLLQEEADMTMHPDARVPLPAEFEGDTNPVTGEQGGPKREPVRRWVEDGGDWSFKGRVSDF